MSKLTYKQAVQRAKDCLENIKTTRFKICELALSVCTIDKNGWAAKTGKYSIKQFAEDIGMPYRTLGKWLEIYRNTIQKLDIKVADIDKIDNRVLRNMTKEVNAKSTKQQVKLAYQKYSKWTKEDYALDRNIKYMVGVRNMLQDYSLHKLDQNRLNELFRLLDECQEAKHQYLRNNKNVG